MFFPKPRACVMLSAAKHLDPKGLEGPRIRASIQMFRYAQHDTLLWV